MYPLPCAWQIACLYFPFENKALLFYRMQNSQNTICMIPHTTLKSYSGGLSSKIMIIDKYMLYKIVYKLNAFDW